MDGKSGLILWVLGGTGVLLMYSAYKNRKPQEVLAAHLAGTSGGSPGDGTAATAPGTSTTTVHPVDYSTGTGAGGLDYLYDAHGGVAGVVPAPYQGHSKTYIGV